MMFKVHVHFIRPVRSRGNEVDFDFLLLTLSHFCRDMSYLDFVSKQIEESVQYMSSPIRNTNCKLGIVSGDTLIVSTGEIFLT
jgi:hypothetical protein